MSLISATCKGQHTLPMTYLHCGQHNINAGTTVASVASNEQYNEYYKQVIYTYTHANYILALHINFSITHFLCMTVVDIHLFNTISCTT